MNGNAQIKDDLLSFINRASIARDAVSLENHPSIEPILAKIAPLPLHVSPEVAPRVNVLIGIIDFNYFFGGYISVFNFAKRLFLDGYSVRMITVDPCALEPVLWRQKIKKYEGLEDFFDCVEVLCAHDRSEPIACSPRDAFVATSWWTAHIAHAATSRVDAERFLYFSQEYEPIFYHYSILHALSNMSYELPHYALFSTELLRDYHRANRIGLFKGDDALGEKRSVAFSNAIVKLAPDVTGMSIRKVKRLLFYARPESHAARNLFELSIMALCNAIRGGVFDAAAWEFYGIGSLNDHDILLDSGRNARMKLLPKVSLNEYRELLPRFDLGMSLMLSPHPSLVPIEMASAGMIVVTNTYANKTADSLRSISKNFTAAYPTIDGIAEALHTAVQRVSHYQDRINGSAVNWPENWEEVFDRRFMDRVRTFIHQEV